MHTIGVIGLGSIGKRHALNLLKLGHAVVVQDVNENAVKDLIGVGATAAGEVDAYVVAAPTEFHIPIYEKLTASSSGKKPIFMEKPLGHVMPERTDQIVMVGYNLRFHRCVVKAKQWLLEGKLGTPVWGKFTCAQLNTKPAYLRDGVILNWSHEIDLSLYLLGDATVVTSCTAVSQGKDYMTDIIMSHKNGAVSTVHLDYLTDPEVRGFTISGSNGVIRADLVKRTISLDGKYQEYCSFDDSYDDNYVEEIRAFLDRVDGRPALGATAEEAKKVMEICLKVREQAGLC